MLIKSICVVKKLTKVKQEFMYWISISVVTEFSAFPIRVGSVFRVKYLILARLTDVARMDVLLEINV